MESMKMITKTDKIFFSFTQDDVVHVIGSRKVNQIDLSLEFENYNLNSFYGGSVSGCIPGPMVYNLTGSMRGFIQVVGNTFEEAMFNLLLAFREEEREEEQAEIRRVAERAASLMVNHRVDDDDSDYDDSDYDYYYDQDHYDDDYDYCECCER